jgi:hypothetical protein
MDAEREAHEQTVRAEYEPRISREIKELENEIRQRYEDKIEAAIAKVLAEAEAEADDEIRRRYEVDILDELDVDGKDIRAAYEARIQHEVNARMAAPVNRRKSALR